MKTKMNKAVIPVKKRAIDLSVVAAIFALINLFFFFSFKERLKNLSLSCLFRSNLFKIGFFGEAEKKK